MRLSHREQLKFGGLLLKMGILAFFIYKLSIKRKICFQNPDCKKYSDFAPIYEELIYGKQHRFPLQIITIL